MQAQRLKVPLRKKLRWQDSRRKSSPRTTGSTPRTTEAETDWAIITHGLRILEVNRKASNAIKDYLAEYVLTQQYPTLFPESLNRLRRRRNHIDRYLELCRNGEWNGM